jgi:hypothetical protein
MLAHRLIGAIGRGCAARGDPSRLAERQNQWRRHMHMRRMLIVLDNVRTSDQVLPLLPDGPCYLVLITSRRKLTGLTDAYPFSLDVFGWDEAERLLSSWWASTDARTVRLCGRSWSRVVSYRWRSGLSLGDYGITGVSSSPTLLPAWPTRPRHRMRW